MLIFIIELYAETRKLDWKIYICHVKCTFFHHLIFDICLYRIAVCVYEKCACEHIFAYMYVHCVCIYQSWWHILYVCVCGSISNLASVWQISLPSFVMPTPPPPFPFLTLPSLPPSIREVLLYHKLVRQNEVRVIYSVHS